MVKDPNAPKRPATGFILFCNDIRAKVQRENPDLAMTQMSSIMGGKWKELSESQQNSWKAKAAKAKAAYDKKMEKYKKTDDYKKFKEAQNVGGLIKKVCKQFNIECKKRNPTQFPSDPSAPKKAASPFFLFSSSVRPSLLKKFKGKPMSEVAKQIGEQWKKCSETEKAKFQKKADNEKKAVLAKKKKYEKTTSFKNYLSARKEYTKLKNAAMKKAMKN